VVYLERVAAAGFLRSRHAQPEGVGTAGEYLTCEQEMVAGAGGVSLHDALPISAVDGYRADAVLRVEYAVEGDAGTGEGDCRGVTGLVVPTVAVVEQFTPAAGAVLPPGSLIGEPAVVDADGLWGWWCGAGGDVRP